MSEGTELMPTERPPGSRGGDGARAQRAGAQPPDAMSEGTELMPTERPPGSRAAMGRERSERGRRRMR